MNIEKLDGLYQDVWDMVNMTKKSDRIAFFRYWLKMQNIQEEETNE